MTQLSQSFASMALQLVELFGKEGYNIRRITQGDSNPATPTKPGEETVENFGCKAAITDFKIKEIDGTVVLQGDKQVVIAVTDTLPDEILEGDVFVDGDITWNIVTPVNPLEVNGIKVAYILQVRK